MRSIGVPEPNLARRIALRDALAGRPIVDRRNRSYQEDREWASGREVMAARLELGLAVLALTDIEWRRVP